MKKPILLVIAVIEMIVISSCYHKATPPTSHKQIKKICGVDSTCTINGLTKLSRDSAKKIAAEESADQRTLDSLDAIRKVGFKLSEKASFYYRSIIKSYNKRLRCPDLKSYRNRYIVNRTFTDGRIVYYITVGLSKEDKNEYLDFGSSDSMGGSTLREIRQGSDGTYPKFSFSFSYNEIKKEGFINSYELKSFKSKPSYIMTEPSLKRRLRKLLFLIRQQS